jgi:hypothetical protein
MDGSVLSGLSVMDLTQGRNGPSIQKVQGKETFTPRNQSTAVGVQREAQRSDGEDEERRQKLVRLMETFG